MKVDVIIFGQLTEITNGSISLSDVPDTDSLVKELHKLYPALADAKYVMAVNKQVVVENTALTDKNTVALLPPFSGG